MPFIYLAGAIDREIDRPAWRKEIKDALAHEWSVRTDSLTVYDPRGAFSVFGPNRMTQDDAQSLVLPNLMAIKKSDIVLVRYMPTQETWGTPMEVVTAHDMGSTVIVWTEEKFLEGLVLRADPGFMPTYLLAHAWEGQCYIGAEAAAEAVIRCCNIQRRGTEKGVVDSFIENLKKGLGSDDT